MPSSEPVSCLVPGCDRPVKVKSRGLCWSHYQRWYTHGDPEGGRTERGALPRFIDEAVAYKGDEHLLWPFGSPDKNYYPVILLDGQAKQVNRVICKRVNGPPPSDRHEAAHDCGIKRCCTPRHIYWATPKENMADTIKHGTRGKMNRLGSQHTDEVKIFIGEKSKKNWYDPVFIEKMRKRVALKGEHHGRSKLTATDVAAIRALNGKIHPRELAEQFKVSKSCICAVLSGRTWK